MPKTYNEETEMLSAILNEAAYQDSFGPYFRKISNHLMAIDAVRAWLEVRGEVDND